jgi:hypothetical protein
MLLVRQDCREPVGAVYHAVVIRDVRRVSLTGVGIFTCAIAYYFLFM